MLPIKKNYIEQLPKMTKPGSLHLEWKRCGRPNCRCATGEVLHGPYAVHHWRQNGVHKKRYVPAADIIDVLFIIQEWNNERENLAKVRRYLQEIKSAIRL
ncbi:MAG: DUF6788 family protein [Verrucomicrobiaceae bacterium]